MRPLQSFIILVLVLLFVVLILALTDKPKDGQAALESSPSRLASAAPQAVLIS